MTTGNMPNPPDHLSTQATAGDVQGQATADIPGVGDVGTATQEAPTLGVDMARILEEEADVLAQQMVYHSQIMFGVGAMGTDAVNARNSVMIIANALRNGANAPAVHTLANLADAQISQVNDRTLPFKTHSQIAGLLEGLLLDSISRGYKDDSHKQREARAMLDGIFQKANERAWVTSKGLVAFQAPGPHPNARV
jgi:hypothetical protein